MTFSKLGTDTETGQMVYLPKASRTKGVYILGLQGAGKSGLIENLCIEDGKQGTGFCVIDPHGELIDNVISRLPANREQDVIYLDIHDYHHPFGLNLFTCSDPSNPLLVQEVVDQVMHVFEMLLDVTPTTPQILDYLRNCTNVLVANPGYTMAEVTLLLKNKTCREKLLQHVSDANVLSFWHDYFDHMPASEQRSESISLERRVRHFLQALTVNIVGQSTSSIDFRFVMDEAKILLVKLDSLRLRGVTQLIGALIISLFLNAAPSRTRGNLFNIYADEFPLYASEDFVTLIEQARKRHIGLAMAHQNRGQLDARTSLVASKLRDRTLGTKQKIIFAITFQDADDDIAGEFDTTPPPSKQEEVGRQQVQTPVHNPLGSLAGKTYPNAIINDFVAKYITASYNGTKIAIGLDLLLYQIEISKNPYAPSSRVDVDNLAYYIFQEYFYSKFRYLQEPFHHWSLVPQLNNILYLLLTTPANRTLQFLHQTMQSVMQPLQSFIRENLLHDVEQTILGMKRYIFYVEETHQYSLYPNWSQLEQDKIVADLRTALPWCTINPPIFTVTSYEMWHKQTSSRYTAWKYKWIEGQERFWYSEATLQTLIQQMIQAFETFIVDLWRLMDEVAVNPIVGDSGMYQPIYRPGPVRPYQDIKNDIANQLSGLPNFTARVKLDDTFPQNPGKKCLSCTLLNNPGALKCTGCGEKLPAPNEYTIETIKPTGYLGTQQLDQRIKRIQANNRRDGYVKKRADVEAEITQRQSGCSGGAAPVQPQQPQQQAQARHARQVPVQGQCPKCNATNPRGAKFCNQCGSPI